MPSVFETDAKMPTDPSKEVVRSQLAEPFTKDMAPVPGLQQTNNHVTHVPISKIGKNP